MKVLITGGAGFIGSYLTEFLNTIGVQVIIIDKLSPQVHGPNAKESFLYKKVKDKAVIYENELTECPALDEIIEACDYIIHLASETGTGQSMYEIGHYVHSNSYSTAFLLEKVVKREHNIKKFILASSRAVYGEGKYFCEEHGIIYPGKRIIDNLEKGDFECKCPICGLSVEARPTCEDSRLNPMSIYGITKFNQEQLVKTTCEAINLPYTIFRFQNVYGKGQSLSNPYTGILSIFSNLIMAGKEIDVFEDGIESRDFIHVSDIVKAIYLDMNGEIKNQIFNVGVGLGTNIIQLVKILQESFQHKFNFKVSGSFRIGDIRHNFADISKIQRELDFKPEIQLNKGIKELLQWVKQSSDADGLKNFNKSISEMERLKLLIKMK